MAFHRYKFLVTFANAPGSVEFETAAASDENAWKAVTILAHEHKRNKLKGLGAYIEQIERIR